MRYLSVCSGIEAATVAWHPLGWEAAAFSEIEKFPRAVLEHHYPNTPLHGDFTTIKGDEYGPIDLLVGGTPCQSFSVAGLRGGMDDPRGNLALGFLQLARRTRARWVVWENVPGVLSSNGGRDFGAILGGLAELGYGWSYRVLDAQFFGVAQRRRRVFVVGYLGDWRRAAAVLFERHSLSGHPAPRREAGEGFAADAAPCLTSSGRGVERTGETRGQDPVVAVVAPPLTSNPFGDHESREGLLVAHTLKGEGFDASEDGTGRGTPIIPVCFGSKDFGGDAQVDLAPTLRSGGHDGSHANAGVPPAIAYSIMPQNSGKDYKARPVDVAQPVMAAGPTGGNQGGDYIVTPILDGAKGRTDKRGARDGTALGEPGDPMFTLREGSSHAVAYAIQERAVCENPNAGPDGAGFRDDGAAYTLEARTVPQAVAFALRGREGGSMPETGGDVSNALRTPGGGASVPMVAFAQNQRDELRMMEVAGALAAEPGMKQQTYALTSAVRRLTPTECERLQGFPDGYTDVPYRGKPASDGPRYKALGNSMAVPVMAWIGRRIEAVEALQAQQEAA